MKKLLSLLTLIILTGCAAGPGAQSARQAAGGAGPAITEPRYEHQLDVVYTEGATPFLHVVSVQDR